MLASDGGGCLPNDSSGLQGCRAISLSSRRLPDRPGPGSGLHTGSRRRGGSGGGSGGDLEWDDALEFHPDHRTTSAAAGEVVYETVEGRFSHAGRDGQPATVLGEHELYELTAVSSTDVYAVPRYLDRGFVWTAAQCGWGCGGCGCGWITPDVAARASNAGSPCDSPVCCVLVCSRLGCGGCGVGLGVGDIFSCRANIATNATSDLPPIPASAGDAGVTASGGGHSQQVASPVYAAAALETRERGRLVINYESRARGRSLARVTPGSSAGSGSNVYAQRHPTPGDRLRLSQRSQQSSVTSRPTRSSSWRSRQPSSASTASRSGASSGVDSAYSDDVGSTDGRPYDSSTRGAAAQDDIPYDNWMTVGQQRAMVPAPRPG